MTFARQCLHLSLISLWFTFFCEALAQDVPSNLGVDAMSDGLHLHADEDDTLAERFDNEEAVWNRVQHSPPKFRFIEGEVTVIGEPPLDAFGQTLEREFRVARAAIGPLQGRAPPFEA